MTRGVLCLRALLQMEGAGLQLGVAQELRGFFLRNWVPYPVKIIRGLILRAVGNL